MKKTLIILLLASLASTAYSGPKDEKSSVKAVVFYNPGCCLEVLDEALPRLKKKHGRRLLILGVDASLSDGGKLYLNVLLKFNIPLSQELPLLIAGGSSFRGSSSIKKNFPYFIEKNLGRGGVDWPDVPRLKKILKEIKNNPENSPARWVADKSFYRLSSFKESALRNFRRDPWGQTFAVAIESLMIFSLLASFRRFFKPFSDISRIFSPRLFPVLSIIGLLIAVYLSVVKISGAEAVCGPIGDCESVQTSSYAELFGVVPVAFLGAGCFMFVSALWFSRRFGSADYKKHSLSALRIILMAGVGFFIYLTYLEIFIIGAVCFWCLFSAAIMTLLLWISMANE